MTDYYLVTKEELVHIMNDCICPDCDECPKDCKHIDEDILCNFRAVALIDEIVATRKVG